jgi:hypothetical protein
MFAPWRFQLKTAQQALEEGRVEDALSLIARERLTDYGPGQQLRLAAGKQFGARAVARAGGGDLDGGWNDVRECRQILGANSDWSQAVSGVIKAEEDFLTRQWQAKNFAAAWERLESLAKQNEIDRPAVDSLKEVSRRLESAHKLSSRAKFAEAEEQYAAAYAARNDLGIVGSLRMTNHMNQETARQLEEKLHAALAGQDWQEVLRLADEFLVIAPQCHLARDARRRAWGEVGASLGETNDPVPRGQVEEEPSRPTQPRFLLWIDSVGGFLVCLGNEVILGQAQPQGEADVPLQADISRRHARLVREAEGYLLEPLARTLLNGNELTQTALLKDGDILEFNAVRMRFRKPHALSSSARLEFLTRHRTHPYADGVVLMAESCVLGPQRQSHVLCRPWRGDVILYRQTEDLFCRGKEALEIDGKLVEGRAKIGWNSNVAGTDFAMKLEKL